MVLHIYFTQRIIWSSKFCTDIALIWAHITIIIIVVVVVASVRQISSEQLRYFVSISESQQYPSAHCKPI